MYRRAPVLVVAPCFVASEARESTGSLSGSAPCSQSSHACLAPVTREPLHGQSARRGTHERAWHQRRWDGWNCRLAQREKKSTNRRACPGASPRRRSQNGLNLPPLSAYRRPGWLFLARALTGPTGARQGCVCSRCCFFFGLSPRFFSLLPPRSSLLERARSLLFLKQPSSHVGRW